MKPTRRSFLTILFSSLFLPRNTFSVPNPVPGDFKVFNRSIQVSGMLKLSDLDKAMKVSAKEIYGDGHAHVVPISPEAWDLLLKGKELVVRSDVDSSNQSHSHWIKVS